MHLLGRWLHLRRKGRRDQLGRTSWREGKQLGRGEAGKFGCHKIWNLCVWPGAGPYLFPGLSFPFYTLVGPNSWSLMSHSTVPCGAPAPPAASLSVSTHSRQRVNAAQRPEQFLGLSGQPLLCAYSALSPHSDPKFPRSCPRRITTLQKAAVVRTDQKMEPNALETETVLLPEFLFLGLQV